MAIKETIPFNFDEIYAYIENKFIQKGYDVEEGSNTMQLVTAMSYLTSMLNANTAININETLLTQARKRNMVIRDARTLGYELAHKQSYRYNLTLNFTKEQTYSIKRYTTFVTGSCTYYYMGDHLEDFTVTAADNATTKYYVLNMSRITCEGLGGTWSTELGWATFEETDVPANFSNTLTTEELAEWNALSTAADQLDYYITHNGYELLSYVGLMKKLEVREGTLHKYTDNSTTLIRVIELQNIIASDGTVTQEVQRYIDVPFTDIEENGLDVFLTYIDEDGQHHNKELWSKSTSFMIDKDTVLNKEYVRLDDIDYKTPRIYFKLGEIGKELRVGTFVYINALSSSGTAGEMTEIPSASELDCVVTNYDLVLQGADEESIESIKRNAPLFHNTANRIITKPDYIAFCNRQTAVKNTDVWDGHDEFPIMPGHIWFSFIPSSNIRSLLPIDTTTNNNYILQKLTDRTNWYIEDAEVQGVWSYLEDFKIPTLKFHHRNPIYMDFTYDVEIIKYSVASTRKEQHATLFTVIDDYFENTAENFKFEYFNSNLTRRIDDILTDISGFNINISTSIFLSKDNISQEIIVDSLAEIPYYYKEIRIHLGMPYETVINDDDTINTDKLPDITTSEFLGTGGETLTVDYTTATTKTVSATETIITYDIKLGTAVIGKYRIFNVADPDIEIILFVEDALGHEIGIPESNLTNDLSIDVKYPSPNIRFSRNTMPRLKAVNFV